MVAVQSREGVVDALTRPQGVAGIGIFENAIFSVKMPLAEQNEVRNSPFLVGRTLPDGKCHLDFKPKAGLPTRRRQRRGIASLAPKDPFPARLKESDGILVFFRDFREIDFFDKN